METVTANIPLKALRTLTVGRINFQENHEQSVVFLTDDLINAIVAGHLAVQTEEFAELDHSNEFAVREYLAELNGSAAGLEVIRRTKRPFVDTVVYSGLSTTPVVEPVDPVDPEPEEPEEPEEPTDPVISKEFIAANNNAGRIGFSTIEGQTYGVADDMVLEGLTLISLFFDGTLVAFVDGDQTGKTINYTINGTEGTLTFANYFVEDNFSLLINNQDPLSLVDGETYIITRFNFAA